MTRAGSADTPGAAESVNFGVKHAEAMEWRAAAGSRVIRWIWWTHRSCGTRSRGTSESLPIACGQCGYRDGFWGRGEPIEESS